jgi:hypothetical protein
MVKAPTVLTVATASMAVPCLVLVFGRDVLTVLELEWAPGTLLSASPRKAEALMWLALGTSVLVTPWTASLLRSGPVALRVLVLVALQVALFSPPILVRATVNPGLVTLSHRFSITEIAAAIPPEWSDPLSPARRLDWRGFADAAARQVSEEAKGLELPAWADDAQTRRAIATMHFVSRLWAPGNQTYPERAGCVRDNEDTDFRFVLQAQTTHATYLQSRIACCDDYAHMLQWLLRRAGVQSRVIVAGGHVFVEARLGGSLRVLDSMANVAFDASWHELNTGRPAALLMLTHAATHQGSAIYRLRFAADRWRLISGVYSGGFAWQERPELPPEFPR